MKNLNPEILGEINRKIAKYKSFKSSRMKSEGLEELRELDAGWIKRVCIGDDYRAKPYLEHYERGIE